MEQEPNQPESKPTDSFDQDVDPALVDRAVTELDIIEVMNNMSALNKTEKRMVRFALRNPGSNLLVILAGAIAAFSLLFTTVAFMLLWNNVVSDFLQINSQVNFLQAFIAMGLLSFFSGVTLDSKEKAWTKAYMSIPPDSKDTAEQIYYHELQLKTRALWHVLKSCLRSITLSLIIILAVTFI